MSRVYLTVAGCDDHTSIALDQLTEDELRLVCLIVAGLNKASGSDRCRPGAELTEADPTRMIGSLTRALRWRLGRSLS